MAEMLQNGRMADSICALLDARQNLPVSLHSGLATCHSPCTLAITSLENSVSVAAVMAAIWHGVSPATFVNIMAPVRPVSVSIAEEHPSWTYYTGPFGFFNLFPCELVVVSIADQMFYSQAYTWQAFIASKVKGCFFPLSICDWQMRKPLSEFEKKRRGIREHEKYFDKRDTAEQHGGCSVTRGWSPPSIAYQTACNIHAFR